MFFLMGLNHSFAHICNQLLLLDPIPPINKVFSLISQEERQRTISSSFILGIVDPASNMAFLIRIDNNKRADNSYLNSRNSKKDRPFYTHCNYHGHTIEKCYKLQGYPPRL